MKYSILVYLIDDIFKFLNCVLLYSSAFLKCKNVNNDRQYNIIMIYHSVGYFIYEI